ncbi:MAG: NAD(P)H-dependent oxidoreductase subunit E [Roseiarcus sp.]
MTGKTPWDDAQARAVIAKMSAEPGAALPILHALQERFGYIDDAAIPAIAEALNLSKAEVLGVVGFYHDFRRAPVEGATLKLCRAESCQALGCEGLVAHLSQAHGLKVDHVDANAPLGVETVYCLGNCALSPAGLLDGEPIGRLDRDAIDEIVARTAKRRA